MRTVRDLSMGELRALVADVVEEKLRELLGDPDEGLSLRPQVRERLLKSLNRSGESGQTVSAAQVARRLGLDW